MSADILCPHCQEPGCTGKCRFYVGRRGFIGLALGALATSLLPKFPTPTPAPFYALISAENIYTYTPRRLTEKMIIDALAEIKKQMLVPKHIWMNEPQLGWYKRYHPNWTD